MFSSYDPKLLRKKRNGFPFPSPLNSIVVILFPTDIKPFFVAVAFVFSHFVKAAGGDKVSDYSPRNKSVNPF